jgi:hypothetical protein
MTLSPDIYEVPGGMASTAAHNRASALDLFAELISILSDAYEICAPLFGISEYIFAGGVLRS